MFLVSQYHINVGPRLCPSLTLWPECVSVSLIHTDLKWNEKRLTFCSQSSLRSSLCGELPTAHCASSTSSWLACPPWRLSSAAAGSTVSSFTLTTKTHTAVRSRLGRGDDATGVSKGGRCEVAGCMMTTGWTVSMHVTCNRVAPCALVLLRNDGGWTGQNGDGSDQCKLWKKKIKSYNNDGKLSHVQIRGINYVCHSKYQNIQRVYFEKWQNNERNLKTTDFSKKRNVQCIINVHISFMIKNPMLVQALITGNDKFYMHWNGLLNLG